MQKNKEQKSCSKMQKNKEQISKAVIGAKADIGPPPHQGLLKYK